MLGVRAMPRLASLFGRFGQQAERVPNGLGPNCDPLLFGEFLFFHFHL
jgi:hypothetical protein